MTAVHLVRPAEVNRKPARRVVQVETLERLARKAPATSVAGPMHHVSMTMKDPYKPEKDLLAPAARAGADGALAVPSRVGDQLHYRDGRVTDIFGQPLE